ncbi:MAG: 50S ribosomal protein L3 [Candidatus Diapherotrites archaeon]|nr:50S ribosomal protein L3 [Candidatus Diapherotrites archaeon]
MTHGHKPRAGSLAFYPRVKSQTEVPKFSSFPKLQGTETKALNFLAYKAGMVHIIAKSDSKGRTHFGQEIAVPCTVLECPPLKIFGVRAYKETIRGLEVVTEILTDKLDKNLKRRIPHLDQLGKEKKEGKTPIQPRKTFEDLEKLKETFTDLRLLVHTLPVQTGIGKKKPEVVEMGLSGTKENKLLFAKEKLGKELKFSEVFQNQQFVDIKAVTKGKGFQGPVKRFGIKIQRHKAKYHRKVGSISPWHPATVMWTVPRPGQMGYHNRTEFNKRILKIDSNTAQVNPAGGFTNYGVVKNEFALIAGSVPGPVKRCIGLRYPTRSTNEKKWMISEITFVHNSVEKQQAKEKAA